MTPELGLFYVLARTLVEVGLQVHVLVRDGRGHGPDGVAEVRGGAHRRGHIEGREVAAFMQDRDAGVDLFKVGAVSTRSQLLAIWGGVIFSAHSDTYSESMTSCAGSGSPSPSAMSSHDNGGSSRMLLGIGIGMSMMGESASNGC